MQVCSNKNYPVTSYWQKVPIVRFFIPFAAGIGINIFFSPSLLPILALTLVSATLQLVFHVLNQKGFINNHWVGYNLNLLALLCGLLLNQLQDQRRWPNFVNGGKHLLLVQLTEQPEELKNSVKCFSKVLFSGSDNTWKPTHGNVLLYFKADSSFSLKYGDIICIENKLTTILPPQNPYEFNYARYLGFKQVYYQQYVSRFTFTGINQGHFLQQFSYSVQTYIKTALNNFVDTKSAIGVAQALLYGFDNDVDEETIKAYGNTGTLHVLAVSGMHVGIIFWVLNILLMPLTKLKVGWAKVLHALCLLVFIWCYALLCGFSPSILRAVVMFSFVIVAKARKRQTSIYNSLAASALILTAFNTNIIANVGFQLSYMAVLGIVTLYPLLYKQLSFESRIPDTIWKISCVSVAAQLATFPLGLLYFHQFPVYFLLGNLLIIPLTTLIIYLGIVLIIVSKFGLIASLLGFLFTGLITITNMLVKWLSLLPYASIGGISINEPYTVFIYLFMVVFIWYWVEPTLPKLHGLCYTLIAWICLEAAVNFNTLKQKEVIVFSIRNHSALALVQGKEAALFMDDSLIQLPDKIHFHIQQYLWAKRLKNVEQLRLGSNCSIKFNECTINVNLPDTHCNLLLLTNAANCKPVNAKVIAGGKLKPYEINKLKQRCYYADNQLWVLANKGAYREFFY